jgi:GH18 family chitinase
MTTPNIKLSLCTHVVYAFYYLNVDGSIADIQWGNIGAFISAKNSYPNVKFLISFGGSTNSENFNSVSGNSDAVDNFVRNVLNFIKSNGIHGGELNKK